MTLATFIEATDNPIDAIGWKRAVQRALHPSTRRVEADVLAAIAEGLARVTVPWELREGTTPSQRRYQRVLATPEYEAWVICWPSGGALDLHDHGGSAGAFSVVSGELDEATIEATSDGYVTVVRTYTAGDTSAFGSARVHAIANRGTEPATSVHVYSPALSSMVYYEHDEANGLVVVAEDAGGWL